LAGISDEKLQELRERVDLETVVGRRVQLKRSGHDLRGLCPFHGEKTPSFYVVPDKRIYHCFGCNKTGDAIRFVMELEGRSFREAVEQLATEFGVVLEADDPGERERTAQRALLAQVNEQAATFFVRVLWEHPRGAPAREHLAKRGIREETARSWALGYAPPLWDALCKSLQRRKIEPRLVEEAGLAVPRRSGRGAGTLYDRFRGRVMIPIRENGRTVAFGGRLLEGESEAKYLNSPETPLYQKGHTLFGLDRAREAIRREGAALFVEGYFDAIGLHQAGIGAAVATCGTSLTEKHLELVLRSGAKELVFIFDGDAAGLRAAARASELAAAASVPARVLVPPNGEDPDETVGRIGTAAFQALVRSAEPSLEFLLERALASVGAQASIEARVRAVAAVAGIVEAAPSQLARDLYVDKVAERLAAPVDAVRLAVKDAISRASQAARAADERKEAPSRGSALQQTGASRAGRSGASPRAGNQAPTGPGQAPQEAAQPGPRREAPRQELSIAVQLLQSAELAQAAEGSGKTHSFAHAGLRELCERAFAAARAGAFDGRQLLSEVEPEALRQRLAQAFDEMSAVRALELEADPGFSLTEKKRLLVSLAKHLRTAGEEEIRERPRRRAAAAAAAVNLVPQRPPPTGPDQKTSK
jgi:DNA primase